MEAILDNITYYIYLVLIITASLSMFCGIIFYFLYKKRKKNKETMQDVRDDKIKKKMALDLVDVDNVIDNMMVLDNGLKHVMVIRAFGCEYFTAFQEEKNKIEYNYTELWNVVNEPIQYQMQSRRHDISVTLDRYESVLKKWEGKRILLEQEMANIYESKTIYEKEGGEEMELLLKKEDEIFKKLGAAELTIESLNEQLARMEHLVKNRDFPKRHHYYILSHTFNAVNFSVELTKGEIRQRAQAELATRAGGIISALGRSNVYAYVVKGDELVDVLRKHYRPHAGDDFKYNQFQSTDYEALVVKSDGKSSDRAMQDFYDTIRNDYSKEGA